MLRRLKYWTEWGRWYRWPSYIWNQFRQTEANFMCCCVDGSNDFYWNGWFKRGKDCECGG